MSAVPVDRTPQPGLAVAWWTTCTLWGYFTFGQLVVALRYPEALAVLGVVAAFAAAGRRVRALFADAKAVALGAVLALLLGVAFSIVGPSFLASHIPEHFIALVALLSCSAVALSLLRLVRRREREAIAHAPAKSRLFSVVGWLLVFGFTTLAVVSAAMN